MSTAPPAIVPEQVFYSVFRSLTTYPLYVSWAGSHGMMIQPGERFRVQGDPRIPQAIPTARKAFDNIIAMVEDGVLEFVSSPAVIIDNQIPDGRSTAILSKDGDMYQETVPVDRVDAEARVLPEILPTATYDDVEDEITVVWTTFAGLEVYDKYNLIVTTPEGVEEIIKCGPDKQVKYVPSEGPGDYVVVVQLLTIDGQTKDGTAVTVAVA